MKSVLILGNGQLSEMIYQAGKPLGIKVYPIGINTKFIDLPISDYVITTEIERWPETLLTSKLAHQEEFINRDILPYLSDRLNQKQLLNNMNLATVPWNLLNSKNQWPQLFSSLGKVIIVKRRIGGYDGRGQWKIDKHEINRLPDNCYGECIVEKYIDFSDEVSLIGARGKDGKIVFYPLTHNLHEEGILRISIAFPKGNNLYQQQAETMLSAIMQNLNYVGVIVMECFVTSKGLLINELALRVHNSGHWTQHGASISQFELHLRALLKLPLPKPVVFASSVMINLIGIVFDVSWLKQPLVHLHWYNKEIQKNRKVGHLNLTDNDVNRLTTELNLLIQILPSNYTKGITWAIEKCFKYYKVK